MRKAPDLMKPARTSVLVIFAIDGDAFGAGIRCKAHWNSARATPSGSWPRANNPSPSENLQLDRHLGEALLKHPMAAIERDVYAHAAYQTKNRRTDQYRTHVSSPP
jgi:hypothetical protein